MSGERVMREIVVKGGDSLSVIAQRELGDGNRWPDLWRVNRDRIAAEHKRRQISPRSPEDWVFPGMKLRVPLP